MTNRTRRTKAEPRPFEDAGFLNIDLDVRSRSSLAPLVAAWPWSYQPLSVKGRPDARWLILNAHGPGAIAEATAKELLQYIESLRGAARRCWKQAHRRTFARYRDHECISPARSDEATVLSLRRVAWLRASEVKKPALDGVLEGG
jgi:hypothetical protein